MKKISKLFSKNAKNLLPSPHSAAMNSEFMAAIGGKGIYRARDKGAGSCLDPVLIPIHLHWVMEPTDAYGPCNYRHRIVA